MATYFNTKVTPQGSPEAASNAALQERAGKAIANPSRRDIPGTAMPDFLAGKMSIEDLEGTVSNSATYDPSKGPQINYGAGPQSLTNDQQGALASGQSINAVSNMIPQNVAANQAVAQQNQDIQSRYKDAFEQVKETPAPTTSSGGMAGTKAAVTPAPAPVLPGIVQSDTGFTEIQQLHQDYLDTQNQRKSLTQEYQNMLTTSGIEGIDTELLNMKNIIEGTEDDIRNEVTKAGGFATDSQVMALANARNKQVVKNYNNLLETRNNIEKRLDTMMSLSSKDREMAMKEFDSNMNYKFKLAEFTEKAKANTKETYDNIIENSGYKGLYEAALASGDKDAFSKIYDSTGLNITALEKLATQPDLDEDYKKAQIANLYSEIADRKRKGESAYDPAQLLGYAQQYASTGQIPTGIEKGTFGQISQAAKELPKSNGTIVNKLTGVADSKSSSIEQQDFGRLNNILQNSKRLKELDAQRSHGLMAGISGKLFGAQDQAKYLAVAKSIIDDMQRMQSGAALTEEETQFYSDYLPGAFAGTTLSPSVGIPLPGIRLGQDPQAKIQNFVDIIDNRLTERLDSNGLSMYGYSKVDVGGQDFIVGEIVQNEQGRQGRVNPDGTISILQ